MNYCCKTLEYFTERERTFQWTESGRLSMFDEDENMLFGKEFNFCPYCGKELLKLR